METSDVSDDRPSRTSSVSEDSEPISFNLYKHCEVIISRIEAAVKEKTGWVRDDAVTAARLREVTLSLKHWKSSVRWCAAKDEMDDVVPHELQLYDLLALKDVSLLRTIRTYMYEISESLDAVHEFYTNDAERNKEISEESPKIALLEGLETAVYCLSLQLIPLQTFSELNIKPRAPSLSEAGRQTSSIRKVETEDQITPQIHVHATGQAIPPFKGSTRKLRSVSRPELFTERRSEVLGLHKRRKIRNISEEFVNVTPLPSSNLFTKIPRPPTFMSPGYEILEIDWVQRSQRARISSGYQKGLARAIKQHQRSKPAQAALGIGSTLYKKHFYSSIDKSQTRLLLVMPGEPDDLLYASFLTVDDRDLGSTAYPYSALSYAWGNEEDLLPVIIQPDPKSTKLSFKSMMDVAVAAVNPGKRTLKNIVDDVMEITKSRTQILIQPHLYEALQRLRQSDTVVALWVDYLCINQDNIQERSEQVAKMPEIFRKAYNVCAWLGTGLWAPEDAEVGTMDQFVTKVIRVNLGVDSKVRREPFSQTKRLIKVLNASWFTRRWVIQDVAVAQNVTIHFDSSVIDWLDFQDAISMLSNKTFPWTPRSANWLTLEQNEDAIDFRLDECHASLLSKLTSGLFRRDRKGKLRSTKDLETLVCLSSKFACSDPRDTIHALSKLATEFYESNKTLPDPDYSKNTVDTYVDFVIQATTRSVSLDILCRRWAMPCFDAGLPSWIGVLDHSAATRDKEKVRVSLVGLPGENLYNACGKSLDGESKQLLYVGSRAKIAKAQVEAWFIGSVDTVVKISRILSQESFEMLGWSLQEKRKSNSIVPDKAWRTLVADRTWDGQPVPTYYRRAFLHSVTHLVKASSQVDIERALQESDGITREYLTRVRDVTSGRTLVRGLTSAGSEEELVGLCPQETQTGDLVAILFGCSVPVILRECVPPRTRHSYGVYRLIGEAYIHGHMEGEAVDEDVEPTTILLQ